MYVAGANDDDSFEEFVRSKKPEARKREEESKIAPQVPSAPAMEPLDALDLPEPGTDVRVDPLADKANYELLFALDRWLTHLEDVTAPTRFLELSASDVVRLLKGEDVADLEAAVDCLLQLFEGGQAFCKLHTRSPKVRACRGVTVWSC